MPGSGSTARRFCSAAIWRDGRPVLPDPMPAGEADALLVEATYGDRLHEPNDGGAALARMVNETVARGGKLVIPAFAIGRVEEVLYWLNHLEQQRQIPALPVYVDSPMAAAALKFYASRYTELDPDLAPKHRTAGALSTSRMVTITSARESAEVADQRTPSIVIAASGMATGGRVLDHLATTLPDARNTVLFVGFQAAGTRGRQLVEGGRQVKLRGQTVPVLARIEQINSMSAHADANEIMQWLSSFPKPPKMTYLVHGEPPSLDALQKRIISERGWSVHVPSYLEKVELAL